MEGAALNQEMVFTPLLPPKEGRVENLQFQFISSFNRKKEKFLQYLGHTMGILAVQTPRFLTPSPAFFYHRQGV